MICDEKTIKLQEESRTIIEIKRENMEITGEQIYDSLFKDIPINEKIEIEITGRDSLSKNDSIVFDRFNELIQAITSEISKTSLKKGNA